jgi:carbonic anhydrase
MKAVTQNKNTQTAISPQEAIQLLKEGNERFLARQQAERDLQDQIHKTSGGQWPFAVVLSCVDSRVPAEIVFDQGIGDIFSTRVAGNFVNEDILGSMEYACAVAGSKLVLVMGHTGCGAVKSTCDHVLSPLALGNITPMLNKLTPAVHAVKTQEDTDRSSENADFVNQVVEKNVEMTIEDIRMRSPVLKGMEEEGKIAIRGAIYDISSGKVDFL